MLRSGLHRVFPSVCRHCMSSRQNSLKLAAARQGKEEERVKKVTVMSEINDAVGWHYPGHTYIGTILFRDHT